MIIFANVFYLSCCVRYVSKVFNVKWLDDKKLTPTSSGQGTEFVL